MSQPSINDVAIKLLTAMDEVNTSTPGHLDFADDLNQLNTDVMMLLGSLLNRARKLSTRSKRHRAEKESVKTNDAPP